MASGGAGRTAFAASWTRSVRGPVPLPHTQREGLPPMEAPTIKEPLPEVLLPEQIVRGEVVIIHDQPFLIESVQACDDPWTHRPALSVATTKTTIIYLILTCGICGERAAMKYASSMKDIEWIEIRYKGAFHWLCPSHAAPILDSLASGVDC